MLSDSEFNEYCKKYKLSQAATDYISEVRSGPPSRRVGDGARGNMCGRIPTRALDETVQAESRTSEALFVYESELSPDVLEIWDQPSPIQLRRDKGLRGTHVSAYTPDYLVLRADGPVLVECKPLEKIQQKVAQKPDEWSFATGTPRFRLAEAAAERIGLKHEVYVADDTAPIYLTNLEYLHSVLLAEPAAIRDPLRRAIARKLAKEPMTIFELCAAVRWLEPPTITALIVKGELFGALRVQLLTQHDVFRVFSTRESAEQFESELLQVYRSVSEAGKDTDLAALVQASPTELARAIEIYEKLQQVMDGKRKPTRNEYRYLKRLRTITAVNGHPLVACLPHYAQRGNRASRLTPGQERAAGDMINAYWATGTCKHVSQLLGHVDSACDASGELHISKESLRLRCRRVAPETVAEGRLGIRGYHAARPPVSAEHATLRCEIPGLIAHLDSTQFDVRVWDSLALSNFCAPPWIYVSYCEATDRALGAWLGFGRSDRFALSLTFRDLVVRQGRVPPYFIVDRGAEYGSTFWETLLASADSTKYRRPSGAPRFGGLEESSLKQINDEIANRLKGATWADQRSRSASGSKKSRATARLELAVIIATVRWYLFDVWGTTRHGAADGSPDELSNSGLPLFGPVGHVMKPDLPFLIATSVPVDVKLGERKGIRCGYRQYWSDELNAIRRPYKFEATRLDPATPSILYVKTKDQWITTFARDHSAVRTLSAEGQFLENYRLRTNAGIARQEQRGAHQRIAERVETLELSHAAAAADIESGFTASKECQKDAPARPAPKAVDLDRYADIPYTN